MPYPVFVIIGIVLWQTFTEALNSPLLTPAGCSTASPCRT
jgi:hypothetical protein